MTNKHVHQRFILIVWPSDHEEDLAQHACDIQDALVDMGGPQVFAPIPVGLHNAITEELK